MRNKGLFVAVLIVQAWMFYCGWATAHREVARECERQGSFYVGERDFICAPKGGEDETLD